MISETETKLLGIMMIVIMLGMGASLTLICTSHSTWLKASWSENYLRVRRFPRCDPK